MSQNQDNEKENLEVPVKETVEEINVITSINPSEELTLGFVGDGTVMGVSTSKKEKKPVVDKPAKKKDIVAIYSTRNVTWSGVGKVYTGYNIVSKEASEKWLTRDHTRLATPEEVAQEFNN